jgi:plasmid stabilization system protein ParE
MTARLVVRDAAEADIAEAALWYEKRAHGLGFDFLRATDVALAEIRRNPRSFPVVHRAVRRALMNRYPYGLFFVVTEDTVIVLACMHARRRPLRWGREAGE